MKRNSSFKKKVFSWFYPCNWEQNVVHSCKITKCRQKEIVPWRKQNLEHLRGAAEKHWRFFWWMLFHKLKHKWRGNGNNDLNAQTGCLGHLDYAKTDTEDRQTPSKCIQSRELPEGKFTWVFPKRSELLFLLACILYCFLRTQSEFVFVNKLFFRRKLGKPE